MDKKWKVLNQGYQCGKEENKPVGELSGGQAKQELKK